MRTRTEPLVSRRMVLAVKLLLIAVSATRGEDVRISSPDGRIQFDLVHAATGLEFQVHFKDRPVLDRSRMCFLLDEAILTRGVTLGKAERYEVNEKYPWRGGHAEATNRGRGATIPVEHLQSKSAYTLEVRAYDDGVAFRFLVPGGDKPRVPDESTTFVVPAGSTVWYHDLGGHYEAVHTQKPVADVPAGQWAAPPVTLH